MEKYHDWRDPYTGIHPFLPAAGGVSVLGAVLAVVRLPLVLALLAVWLLLDAALPPLRGVWGWLLGRPLLLVAGCWLSRSTRGSPPRGSLLFCAHKSYWDALVAAALWSPAWYVHVFGERLVAHGSLLSCLLFVAVARSPSGRATRPLAALKQLSGRVVCFVEGATSNHEKCLLRLDDGVAPALDALGLASSFAVIAYTAKAVAFAGLNESLPGHVFRALTVPWQSVRVLQMGEDAAGFEAGWDKLALASGHRRVNKGWADKDTFRERYCGGQ